MKLIDRYVTEVGKRLPRKTRLDIEAELRSTLEDMLEDRAQQTGRPVDEALATELLQEYGSPKQIAATYQARPFLVGPSIFPIYTLVLKIALFAVTLGLSIATIVSVIGSSMTPPEVLQFLANFAAGLVSTLIAVFGNITLVFAILERVLPASELEKDDDWTPEELTKEPDPTHVSMSDMIFSIIFTVAALVIFNFYPQIIGVWNIADGSWVQIAGLSESFFRYLPWINLGGVLTIVLDIWLLRQGVWNALTRWLHIGLEFYSIVIAAAMLRGPSLLTFFSGVVEGEAANILARIFGAMIPIILVIVIVVSTIEIIKDVLRLRRPRNVAYPVEKIG